MIHQAKTKQITAWRRSRNVILIIIKFCELLLRISPRIINSLRSYIKHSKEGFLLFPNTSKRLVFPTYFSVFGNRRKHSSSSLICYLICFLLWNWHLNLLSVTLSSNTFKSSVLAVTGKLYVTLTWNQSYISFASFSFLGFLKPTRGLTHFVHPYQISI